MNETKRFYFDFDDVVDWCGVDMPSVNHAVAEAILSMPEYLAETLETQVGAANLTCNIRSNEGKRLFRIVINMHVEDASGSLIDTNFNFTKSNYIFDAT